MFGVFRGKDKAAKKKNAGRRPSAEGATGERAAITQARAQIRQTRAEIGEENVQKMARALELEAAKRKITQKLHSEDKRDQDAFMDAFRSLWRD